jgi:hypothetical protein
LATVDPHLQWPAAVRTKFKRHGPFSGLKKPGGVPGFLK